MKKDEEYLKHCFSGKMKTLTHIKKDIKEYYYRNLKAIRETMDDVLESKLTESEQDNLRVKCYDMANRQMADTILTKLNISDDDMEVMSNHMTQEELAKMIEIGLSSKK